MIRSFQTAQWLPFPVDIVFAFFANPANLPPLLPEWQCARIDGIELHPAPPPPNSTPGLRIAAGDDTQIRLSFRPVPLSPLRIAWTVRIEEFRWNQGFADVQLSGPFRYWRQQHLTRPAADPRTGVPGTLLEDRVEYELPLPPFSAFAAPFVELQIAALFRFRQKRTAELLPRFVAQLSAGGESRA